MEKDPIVEEIRNVRKKTEAACGGDWERLAAHYLKVQEAERLTERPLVNGSPQRPAFPPKP